MARKNLFEVAEAPDVQLPVETPRQPLGRPLLGLDRSLKPAGPVGAISQSLESINSRALRAEEIEKRLAEGEVVVELDPDLVDSSIIIDRLGVDSGRQASLVAQIREHGQQVPILVRPHPETAGRYQIAYGHRRLAAVKEIGRRVRAIVRALTDEQLVVSQGQENNSRTDLTYIERCYFASRLEARGFSRDVIMASLGVDKAALSRMIALVGRLPPEIIEAVGSAPSFGRRRWAQLVDMLEERGKRAKALKLIQDENFRTLSADERFQALYDQVNAATAKPSVAVWATPKGTPLVKITDIESRVTFAFDKRLEPEFAAFVHERLASLYEEFRQRDTD